MSPDIFLYVCVTAAVLTGLVAGIFLAFSDFIMKALKAVTPEGGMEAMQVINRKVYGSVFLDMLFAMTVVAIVIGFYAMVFAQGPATPWIVSGAGLYVAGVMVITAVCNVPMNKHLDALDIASEAGAAHWREYQVRWTRWNHVRTVASIVATLCLIVGCLRLVPV